MRWTLVLALVVAGCGGSKKSVEEPSDEPEGGEEAVNDEEGQFCPPETYEEIESLFKAKTRVVNRCYMTAQERGDVAKGKAGMIALQMKISATGQARDVEISNDTLSSASLNSCVVELVKGWDFPSCGVDVDYNYAYHFAP